MRKGTKWHFSPKVSFSHVLKAGVTQKIMQKKELIYLDSFQSYAYFYKSVCMHFCSHAKNESYENGRNIVMTCVCIIQATHSLCYLYWQLKVNLNSIMQVLD